jgi:hypothetical protein
MGTSPLTKYFHWTTRGFDGEMMQSTQCKIDVRRVVENNDKQRFRLEYINLSAGDTASSDLHKRDFNDESSTTNDTDLKDNLT